MPLQCESRRAQQIFEFVHERMRLIRRELVIRVPGRLEHPFQLLRLRPEALDWKIDTEEA